MYLLKTTRDFRKQFKKLPKEMQRRFNWQFRILKDDPFHYGRPLGNKKFRELKNEGFRVYFVIYKEQIVVLLIGVSNKKTQQNVIDYVKRFI